MVNRGFCSSVGFKYELDCSCFRRDVQDSVLDSLEGKREGCLRAGSTQRRPGLTCPAPPRRQAVRRRDPTGPWCVRVLDSTGCYTESNDDVISDVTWLGVATKQVQREAYMLVYVRIRFLQGVAWDSREDTPYARDEASIDASITPPVLAPARLVGHGTARQESTPTESDGHAERKGKKGITCKMRASRAAPQGQEHKRQRKPLVDKGSRALISASRKRQPKQEHGTDTLSGEEVQQAQQRRSARIHARRS